MPVLLYDNCSNVVVRCVIGPLLMVVSLLLSLVNDRVVRISTLEMLLTVIALLTSLDDASRNGDSGPTLVTLHIGENPGIDVDPELDVAFAVEDELSLSVPLLPLLLSLPPLFPLLSPMVLLSTFRLSVPFTILLTSTFDRELLLAPLSVNVRVPCLVLLCLRPSMVVSCPCLVPVVTDAALELV